MSLLLESHRSTPIRVSWAIWLRRGTWGIVGVGAIFVLLASVLVNVNQLGNDVSILLIVTVKTLAHLSYLYLIFWLLVFRDPPDALFAQRFIFPIVLLVGYLLYFLAAYTGYANIYSQNVPFFDGNRIILQDTLETFTQCVFLVLYFLWLIRDIEELRRNRNRKIIIEKCFWIAIEFIACLILVVRVGHEAGLYKIPNEFLAYIEKDTTIILCLILWVFIAIVKKQFEQGHYRCIYESYLKHNQYEQIEPASVDVPIADSRFTVLDFGCGNGLRLKEISTWCGINKGIDNESIDIIGFDRDQSWGAAFEENFSHRENISFVSSMDEIKFDELKLVVLSHVLYDKRAVKDVTKVLKKCEDGTFVVIRGASPNSFFTLTSMVFSLRLLTPTYSHCWYKGHLNQLVKKSSLIRNDVKESGPDGMAMQEYMLTKDSIQQAENLLTFLYGQTAGDSASRYFNELLSRGDVDHIPNNDIIYIYKIKRT